MMVGPMPMAGAGLFGLQIGMMAPLATLMLHLIWGIVLGFTYQRYDACQPGHAQHGLKYRCNTDDPAHRT